MKPEISDSTSFKPSALPRGDEDCSRGFVHPDGNRKLRVLLIAEAANPEWTSVPLVGWNLASAIKRECDAVIVTQQRNREAFLRAGLVADRDFVCIDNEYIARTLHLLAERLRGGSNKGWTVVTAMSSLSYYSFERQVWKIFKHRLKAGEFDLVHRITPLSPTSQSPIAGHLSKCCVPFIIGPLNGGLPWPKGFTDVRAKEREWLSLLRRVYSFMPYYRSTRSKAAALIAGSRHTLSEFPPHRMTRSFHIPENGVDPANFPFSQRKLVDDNLRLAFVGRLVPYKGADIVIEAIARYLGRLKLDLVIVGDGPQRAGLESLVRERGLSSSVRFAGWIEQKNLSETLADRQLFVCPSIREFGGGVVVEAMALGLVPVVANYGGPPELLDKTSGLVVDFTDRESLIEAYSTTLVKIDKDRSMVERLSLGAGTRARKYFTWAAKAEQVSQIYRSTLMERCQKKLY